MSINPNIKIPNKKQFQNHKRGEQKRFKKNDIRFTNRALLLPEPQPNSVEGHIYFE